MALSVQLIKHVCFLIIAIFVIGISIIYLRPALRSERILYLMDVLLAEIEMKWRLFLFSLLAATFVVLTMFENLYITFLIFSEIRDRGLD